MKGAVGEGKLEMRRAVFVVLFSWQVFPFLSVSTYILDRSQDCIQTANVLFCEGVYFRLYTAPPSLGYI